MDYSVSIYVHLSGGTTIAHNDLLLPEHIFFNLLNAHQGGKRFVLTSDGKVLDEAARIIAINFSSPHVVGMEVRVLNKEPVA